jgi:hypothetical protein
MKNPNAICWVCEENQAVTTHEGHPICGRCLDHFLGMDVEYHAHSGEQDKALWRSLKREAQ